jgi:hypothetical protein
MTMIQVVTVGQGDGCQRNFFALGVDSKRANVHARLKVRIAAKQIVGGPVFLDDKDYVFERDRLSECGSEGEETERPENLAEAGYWNSPLNEVCWNLVRLCRVHAATVKGVAGARNDRV